jgi:acyl-CoA dehydrogenase
MPDLRSVRAFLTPIHLGLAERAAAVCAEELAELDEPASDDDARDQARSILSLLGEARLLDPIDPLDLRGCCVVRELMGAANPLADAVFALQALGAVPIALAGGEELRERWVGPALRGEAMGAFAMTEAEAGSDVGAMSTTARRDGDGYVLEGEKTFISNAGVADFYTVFASTDPERGSRGISAFVVPADTDGLEYLGPQVMSSPHPLGEIGFRGCRVPASARLGEENAGFKLGMMTLDRLRPTVAAAACGMGQRALDEALAHALERRQFGERLADFQLIKAKLARMATELTAARLLTYRAAWEKDGGAARITLEAAMAKSYATEAAQRIIDDAVQVLGGRGVMADHPVDRLYRSVRALRIYEGTTEVQQLVIAGALIAEAEADGADTSGSGS